MKYNAQLPLVLAIASGACRPTGHTPASTPNHGNEPARSAPAGPDIVCELALEASGPLYYLRFDLANHTAHEKIVHYFYPFMDVKLRVTSAGRALQVLPDEYEGPVQPTELHLPPHGRATLRAAIRLAFAAEPQNAQRDRWTSTIIGEPPVDVAATMVLEGEVIAPCAASIPAPASSP